MPRAWGISGSSIGGTHVMDFGRIGPGGFRYVDAGRVLDLSTRVGAYQIQDQSDEGNIATQYSGRYVSLDGSVDDITGSVAFMFQGYEVVVRSSSDTAFLFELDNTDKSIAIVANGQWQTVSFPAAPPIHDPEVPPAEPLSTFGMVRLGANGTGYFEGDVSEVRFFTWAGTAKVYRARYQFNEHADLGATGLDGLPCFDSTGNGHHLTYNGCSGATGEGIDPVFAGLAEDGDKWYFANHATSARRSKNLTAPVGWGTIGSEFEFRLYPTSLALGAHGAIFATFTSTGAAWAASFKKVGGNLRVTMGGYTDGLNAVTFSNSSLKLSSLLNKWSVIKIKFIAGGVETYLNGVLKETDTWTSPNTNYPTFSQIGSASNTGSGFTGIVDYAAADGAVFFDKDSLVNGGVYTVDQMRETILQTAGMDWNRGAYAPWAKYNETSDFDADIRCTLTKTTVAGEANALKTTLDSSVGTSHYLVDNSPNFSSGKKYRITGQYYIPSGQIAKWVQLDQGGYGKIIELKTNGAWTAINHVFTANQTKSFRVYASDGNISVNGNPNGEYFAFKDLKIEVFDDAILIPVSDDDPTVDALGTAIADPRINDHQINLFGDGEYVECVNDSSLDLTTEATWEIWGNFYLNDLSNNRLFSKYQSTTDDRDWSIYKSGGTDGEVVFVASSDGTAANLKSATISGITSGLGYLAITFSGGVLKAYWNGAPITVGSHSLPTSLNTSTANVQISGINSQSELIQQTDEQIGSAKLYDRALTADEVLKNFNAQKSKYGL